MRDETACAGPEGEAATRSHTSRISDQSSLTRSSAVALTGGWSVLVRCVLLVTSGDVAYQRLPPWGSAVCETWYFLTAAGRRVQYSCGRGESSSLLPPWESCLGVWVWGQVLARPRGLQRHPPLQPQPLRWECTSPSLLHNIIRDTDILKHDIPWLCVNYFDLIRRSLP